MTRRKTRAQTRHKWLTDPFVPIVPEILRAAIELDGRGFAAIARDVTRVLARSGRRFDENRQTLYALHRRGRRCRESRFLALAEVLSVPSGWLRGQVVSLPLSGNFHVQRLWHTSPRAALALGRLLQRCSDACMRDLSRYQIATSEGDDGQLLRFEIPNLLCWAVTQLLYPLDRIRLFLRSTAPKQVPKAHIDAWQFIEPMHSIEPMSPNEEACWLSSIRLWESGLEPWIANEQLLRYRALAETTAALYPVMSLQRPASTPPLRVVEVETGSEVAIADADTPFSLMPWAFA